MAQGRYRTARKNKTAHQSIDQALTLWLATVRMQNVDQGTIRAAFDRFDTNEMRKQA